MKQILIIGAMVLALALPACSTVNDTRDGLAAFWEGDSEAAAFEEEASRLPVPELSDMPNNAEVLASTSEEEFETMMAQLEADRAYAQDQAAYFAGQGGEPFMPEPIPSTMNQGSAGALAPQPQIMPKYAMQPMQSVYPAAGQGTIAQALGYVPPSVAGYGMPQMQAQPIAPVYPNYGPASQSVVFNALPQLGLTGQPAMPQQGAYSQAYGTPGALETSIFFGHGSSSLNAVDRKNLAEIAQRVRNSVSPVRIIAHASQRAESGSAIERKLTNLKMSLKRAGNVAKELAKQGVPAEKMILSAHGDSFADKAPQEAEARRVNLLFD